jgi:hypothetical protein
MTKSPNRGLAAVFGSVYLLVGLLGFTATGGVGLFDTTGGLLLGIFEVNLSQNIAHFLIGAALLIAGLSTVPASRRVNTTIGAFSLVLGIAGLFVTGTDLNILALNVPDHALHFGTAAVLLGVGLGADKRIGRSTAAA